MNKQECSNGRRSGRFSPSSGRFVRSSGRFSPSSGRFVRSSGWFSPSSESGGNNDLLSALILPVMFTECTVTAMNETYVIENTVERDRLMALTARLTEEELRRQLPNGWSVATKLAHLAFWDLYWLALDGADPKLFGSARAGALTAPVRSSRAHLRPSGDTRAHRGLAAHRESAA